ncbi:hypothetical protein ACSG7Z_001020 [Cronobacter dublinensis]
MFSFALSPWFKPRSAGISSGRVSSTQEPIMFSTLLNTWMLAGTPDGLGVPFRQEAEAYLRDYPHTRHVDIYLHDLNGCRRGKRVSVESLRALAQAGSVAGLPALPLFWPDALARFQEADWLRKQLGAPFSDAWIACKRQELARFESEVTDAEKRAHRH